ncbi:MAG TPA: CpsB/CapC family capsule biosynthesis tyrosine phosphatase [Solirubrobacteraceae bacterium]|nr:CpsB/CapC family capsule biosynthesis tyrosine phosphatase [Solirubrobacteraceae bacterium]
MIDVHCHILPSLDDGALDLRDSVAMARQADGDGITVVCATPHIRHDHDVRLDELPVRVAELQAELDRQGVGVRIAQGGEVAQSAARRLGPDELYEVSLDRRGWVLLEPDPGPLADELPQLVERLAGLGLRTIIAHPERHAPADLERRLEALAEMGCMIQWTGEFIAALDPDDAQAPIVRLARRGLVHLIGSDAHSSHGGRPLRLTPALTVLGELCPAEQVRWIAHTAPEAILRGEFPAPPLP